MLWPVIGPRQLSVIAGKSHNRALFAWTSQRNKTLPSSFRNFFDRLWSRLEAASRLVLRRPHCLQGRFILSQSSLNFKRHHCVWHQIPDGTKANGIELLRIATTPTTAHCRNNWVSCSEPGEWQMIVQLQIEECCRLMELADDFQPNL